MPKIPVRSAVPSCTEMQFDAAGTASVVPSTVNLSDRTVDVVWYSGVSVPRINQRTGEPYNLRLDMKGAKLDRLNAGAAIFDNHQSGGGWSAMISGVSGTRAQIGVVRKAWADGIAGKATLQFKQGIDGNPDKAALDQIWSDVSTGILQNLSFGTWIYEMAPDGEESAPTDEDGDPSPQDFVATSWEPFEISPVCVPADFTTTFLSAEVTPPVITPGGIATSFQSPALPTITINIPAQPAIQRASAREEQIPVMEPTQQAAGTEARQAVIEEGVQLERARVQAIQLAAKPFAAQLGEEFVSALITEGLTVEQSRVRFLEKLATTANATQSRGEVTITREQNDTRRENMEAALLYRHDPKLYVAVKDKAREYAGMSLLEMARESLEAVGVKTRGLSKQDIARAALNGRQGAGEYFAGSYASSSDFPSILANVANKSLRQAYEAYPSTFKPFCRLVTASDFKPINRVQLSDVSSLKPLNEDGEYHRTTPSDSKETYSLATYGEIIAISRKVIINDDLQAFTRIPALLGVAAAQLEADTVWAIFTGNPTMSDTVALFHATHSNLNTGAGSALALAGLASARSAMRQQKAPKGTPLNLTPRYIVLPTALEQTADQLVAPVNIASSDFTKVVPTWIRSLQPIVEPRLDASSTTGWFLVADSAMIDTIEYCYLEGQEGVFTETRQGFDVDGLEIKARMDFAAAATEFRGLQENAGA